MNNDVDKAYTLFISPRRSLAALQAALQILSQAEVESIYLEPPLRQRIYWGLMTVQKELGCHEGFGTAEKTEHINNALRYCIEVENIVSQSSDASLGAQVSLERHIIEGRKAILVFRVTKDVDQLKRAMSEVKSGIDISLGKLHEVDRKSYDKVYKAATEWREKFHANRYI